MTRLNQQFDEINSQVDQLNSCLLWQKEMMRPSETDKFLRKKERRVRIQVDEDFRSTEADDKKRIEDNSVIQEQPE